jgi:hypothetical protein
VTELEKHQTFVRPDVAKPSHERAHRWAVKNIEPEPLTHLEGFESPPVRKTHFTMKVEGKE